MVAILATTVTAVAGSAYVAAAVEAQREGSAQRVPLSDVRQPCVRDAETSASCLAAAAVTTAPVGLVLAPSIPLTLTIPAIDVDTKVQRLGLAPDGSLAVPAPGPRYDEAGWYRYSPAPGSLGPAIIVGHLDSATDPRSVFYRLSSLTVGDRILVGRADGLIAIFSVDDVRRYRKSQFPTDLVYGNINHAALRLITCGGPIDPSTGHYRDNVIVRASLVGTSGGSRPLPHQAR